MRGAELKDLRGFLKVLERHGELARVHAQVDWDLEIGEIQKVVLARRGPALLFENIKDHQNTWCRKLFTGGMGTRRRSALILGLAADAGMREMTEFLAKSFANPISPVLVNSGPVKENVLGPEEVDLFQLPSPRWHPLDGGRYLNTWCGVVTRDPETGVLNVGLYRGQVLTRNKIGVKLIESKGWGVHYRKYRKLGHPMPVAVFYGGDPALTFLAGLPLPDLPEYDIGGGIRGEGVELVKCETNDLLVPASAEIVVEGSISTDPASYEVEGPFGEWTGYYSVAQKSPVILVDCITYRNDPILTGCLACTPSTVPRESSVSGQIGQSAIIRYVLEKEGVTGVEDIETAPRRVPALVVVKIVKEDAGHPLRVARALWKTVLNQKRVQNVMVVSGEVDIHDISSLLNHLARMEYFGRRISVHIEGGDSLSGEGDLNLGASSGARILIDATFDPQMDVTAHERMVFEIGNEYGPDDGVVALVKRRWKEYGILQEERE